jgi:hypothetical protein
LGGGSPGDCAYSSAPGLGARFEGLLPPWAAAAARRPA